jgi:chromosome segregation ATPase
MGTEDPQIPILIDTINGLEENLAQEIIIRNEFETNYNNALDEIAEKEALLIEKENQINGLINDNVSYINDNENLQNTIDIRNGEITDLLNLNDILQNEKEALILDKAGLQSQIDGLNIDVTNLNDTVQNQASEITNKDAEILSLNNSINGLNSNISLLQTEKGQLESELLLAQNENAGDDVLINGLNNDINGLNVQIATLTEEKNILSAELLDAQGYHNTQLNAWNNERISLEADISGLNSDIDGLNNQVSSITAQLNLAQDNVTNITGQLTQKQQQLDLLTIDYNDVVAENEGYTSDILALDNQISGLQSDLAEQQQLVITKSAELQDYIGQLETMTTNYNLAVAQRDANSLLVTQWQTTAQDTWSDLQTANAQNETMLVELFGEDKVPGGDNGGLHGIWDFLAAGQMQGTGAIVGTGSTSTE